MGDRMTGTIGSAFIIPHVKHLLRKYKYPPEQAKGTIDTVIKQAELMSANMAL